MGVKTYHPAASAVLTKIVARRKGASERFQGFNNRIELTKFLGENGGIKTVKTVHDGAGVFTITCTDEKSLTGRDSLYGLVEPMDHVEIRMSHEPHNHAGGALPIILRGFVTEIRRTETMGNDGKPVRAVVISGQDYTKILMQDQIFYEISYLLNQQLLTKFRLFVNSGVKFAALTSNEFIAELMRTRVDPYMKALWATNALDFSVKFNTDLAVNTGRVAPYGISPYQGTIWNFMRSWGDMAWNELFIQSREEGEYVVYRPTPYKDLSGNLIQEAGGAKDPGTVQITDADVVSVDLSRSDRNVSNYYWVSAPRADLHTQETLRIMALQDIDKAESFFLVNYPNSDPALYGYRKMQVQSDQGHSDDQKRTDAQPEALHEASNVLLSRWAAIRRKTLIAMNRDNVVYEEGMFTLRGDERIRAGMYLALNRGSLSSEYYVNTVSHDFRPFNSYITTAQVSRGTGFLERIRHGSPYEAEGRRGIYA